MKKRRLKNLEDVRRALADVYNRMDQQTIDPNLGSKLAYVANILARLIEGGAFEERLTAIERKLGL